MKFTGRGWHLRRYRRKLDTKSNYTAGNPRKKATQSISCAPSRQPPEKSNAKHLLHTEQGKDPQKKQRKASLAHRAGQGTAKSNAKHLLHTELGKDPQHKRRGACIPNGADRCATRAWRTLLCPRTRVGRRRAPGRVREVSMAFASLSTPKHLNMAH